MTLQEFAALKKGDTITNPMNGSTGTVASANDRGVDLCWQGSTTEFHYSVQSTAWMHWSRVTE